MDILKVKNQNGVWVAVPAMEGSKGDPGEGVASGGTTGQVLKKTSNTDYDTEWGDETVQDVQVDGTSVLNNGVAEIPQASGTLLGVLYSARSQDVKSGDSSVRVVPTIRQHESTFYGLAKAAGDTSQSSSDNAVGTYTNDALVKIQKMLGIYREWELIADVTVNEDSASYEITTDINGEPFALSEILVKAYLEPSTTGTNDYISAHNLIVNSASSNTTSSAPTFRYMTNGAKTYFEYESRIHAGTCLSSGRSASNPGSTSSVSQISSTWDGVYKYFRGFRLSSYTNTSSLIPKNSMIRIYGIRI